MITGQLWLPWGSATRLIQVRSMTSKLFWNANFLVSFCGLKTCCNNIAWHCRDLMVRWRHLFTYIKYILLVRHLGFVCVLLYIARSGLLHLLLSLFAADVVIFASSNSLCCFLSLFCQATISILFLSSCAPTPTQCCGFLRFPAFRSADFFSK